MTNTSKSVFSLSTWYTSTVFFLSSFDKNFVKDGNRVKKLEAGESVTYKINSGSKVNCVMLQENIAKYEKQFGTIKLNGAPAPGSTIPMSFGGGDA